jgi:gliding motility-associated-like protein
MPPCLWVRRLIFAKSFNKKSSIMRYFLLLSCFFCFQFAVLAQSDTVTIFFTGGDTLFTDPNSVFEIDLHVNGFTEVATLSFAIQWDTSSMVLQSYQTSSLSGVIINQSSNYIKTAWAGTSGVSLADNSQLLKLKFKAKQQAPVTSLVDWNLDLLPCEFYRFDGINLTLLPFKLIPKPIVIRNCDLHIDLGEKTRNICIGDSVLITPICEKCQDFSWNTGLQNNEAWLKNTGTYYVYTTGRQECYAADTIIVDVLPLPLFVLPDTISTCEGRNTVLTALKMSNNVDITWSTGETDPRIEVNQEGWFSAIVNDDLGCSSMDSVFVNIQNCKKARAYIPNAFKPKSLGENSTFQVYLPNPEKLTNFKMSVYDRWGELVFSSTDILESWDGRFRGEVLKPNIYQCAVEFAYEYKRKEVVTGDVLVME